MKAAKSFPPGAADPFKKEMLALLPMLSTLSELHNLLEAGREWIEDASGVSADARRAEAAGCAEEAAETAARLAESLHGFADRCRCIFRAEVPA